MLQNMNFLNNLNKKANIVQIEAYSTEFLEFQTSLLLLQKILILFSLIEFTRSLDYKPNHWTFYQMSNETFASLINTEFYKHNKYYLGLLEESQLTIFYKSNLTLKKVYKTNPSELAGDSMLFESDEKFRDFDFVWDEHVVAITTKERFFVFDLLTETFKDDFSSRVWNICSIQVTKSAIYVLGYAGYFRRYERGLLENNRDDAIRIEDFMFPDECLKMEVSEYIHPTIDQQPYVNGLVEENTDIEYVIFYKEEGANIYSCFKINFEEGLSCNLTRSDQSSIDGVEVKKASFSADCTKAILEFDNKSPLLVIDLVKNEILASIEQDSNVLTSEFYNYEATVVMVWNSDMYITLYEVSTGLALDSYSQGEDKIFEFVSVDLQEEMLIMVMYQRIGEFKFYCNTTVPYYYHSVGKCTKCLERCLEKEYCDNETAKCIQKIEGELEEPNENENIEKTLHKQTKDTVEAFSEGVAISGNLASYVIWIFTAIPVASFFLGFINFWTICSFYVLLDIKMPQFLRTSLTNLFIALNSSMFSEFGFVFEPKLFLSEDSQNEKIRNDFAADFELSLDFLLMNSENLLTCAFSIILGFIIWQCFFKKKKKEIQNLNSNNKIKEVKTFSPIFMGFGQVISISPLLILGLMCMKGESGYSKINEKINLICFEISIGMLFCVSPFVITFIKLDKKYIKPVQKIAQTQTTSKKNSLKESQNQKASVFYERLKWVYTLQCNITLPFFVILGYVEACLSVNYLIFWLRVFICYKEPNTSLLRRVNNVAMALEIFVVNLVMTLLVLIDHFEKENSHYLLHIVGIFCLGTILLGAIHELINLIIVDILIDFIIKNCQEHFCKNKILSTDTVNKNREKETKRHTNKKVTYANSQNVETCKSTTKSNVEEIKRNENKFMSLIKLKKSKEPLNASKGVQFIRYKNEKIKKNEHLSRKKCRFIEKRSKQNINTLKITLPTKTSQQIEEYFKE